MLQELEDISGPQLELAVAQMDLVRYVDPEYQPFFLPFAIPTISEEHLDTLAKGFANAVHMMLNAQPHPRLIAIVFGRFPYIAYSVGTGVQIYVADMQEHPLGCASESSVYLHATRLLEIGDERRTERVMLEELVHAWMGVRNETVVAGIVRQLAGAPAYVAAARKRTAEFIAACASEP